MTCQCPQCRRMLRVPDRAASQYARCPACRSTFRVAAAGPRTSEETAFGWMMEDAEAASRAFQRAFQAKVRETAPAQQKRPGGAARPSPGPAGTRPHPTAGR